MSIFRFYNSLSRQKEVFNPIDPDHVRVYACGPTVYSFAHIGNARMAVVFDLLVTLLKTQYPRVTYVSNITDVDDKILQAAAETGDSIHSITRKYEKIYNENMASLGVCQPDIQPRATDHIADMIRLIEQLIDKGHAYAAQGHVMFHVPSFPAYGGLSGRSRDEQIAGARVEIAPYKQDPADFILWKPSEKGDPGWDSPWGYGRPGWHIECSAMAERHLGLPFDIHGGGADLKFPHHENEIAQSCCAHGHMDDLAAFARMWIHNGFVTVGGEKMSKSLGNVMLVHDLLKTWPGEVLRMALLSAHYRQPLDLTEGKFSESKRILDRFYQRLLQMRDYPEAPEAAAHPSVIDALADDLNTPQAFAAMNVLLHESNSPELKNLLLGSGRLLGILRADPPVWLGYHGDEDAESSEITSILSERQEAKKAKNYKRADEIRDLLAARGILIEDTPEGTKWRRA